MTIDCQSDNFQIFNDQLLKSQNIFYNRDRTVTAKEIFVSPNHSLVSSDSVIMPKFSSHLQWFQAKIGSYDKQIWETSVEQRILQGLENRPKREGSLHKELIDIDLVRGSTFSKAKPRHGLKSVIINGLKRVIFFPFYYNHWRDHLTKEVFNFCLFHYTIQMLQLIFYFMWSNSTEVMVEEIALPIVLSLGLGVLHAHIVAPYTVKQRRKKTLSNPFNKGKQSLKNDLNTGLLSRKTSVNLPQLSDNNFPQGNENIETQPLRLDPPISNRSKKKGIAFGKSLVMRSNSFQVEEEYSMNEVKKLSKTIADYSETEAKDSSSSDQEKEPISKGIQEEEVLDTNNDPSCIEPLCVIKKHSKINDGSDRKNKELTRQTSQSFSAQEVPDEELKKFITAKCKKIPDPTPMNNIKKEKINDKSYWKPSTPGIQKTFKNSKPRRGNSEWGVPPNSVVISENVKNQKATTTNMTSNSPVEEISDAWTFSKLPGVIENANHQDSTIEDSPTDKPVSSIMEIKIISTKIESDVSKKIPSGDTKTIQSVSQPHTPLNHYNSKLKHRIDVRKVSSADASPTPSRKNSTCFSTPVDLNREHLESKQLNNDSILITNHSFSNSSQDQGSKSSLNENMIKIVMDNSISSEDMSSKMIDLNEDTITKSHKKREEFKQLFEIKAHSIPKQEKVTLNSSSSSSRKSLSEVTKHNKIKRRYREDHKSSSVENYSKIKKETVQLMSETEYDRMNSDVNSTGNSTSDGEDICSNIIGNNPKSEQPEVIDPKQEFPNNSFSEVNNQSGMNENNPILEDFNRPINTVGDESKSQDLNDDPFYLWYKEIHAPAVPLNGVYESVSCYIWEEDELKKTNLSLLDIGWSIIQAVERHEHDKSYSKFGFVIMVILCFTPIFFRVYFNWNYLTKVIEMTRHTQIIDFLLPNNGILSKYLVSSESSTSKAIQTSDFNVSKYRTYNWSDEIIPLTLTSVVGSEWPIRLIVLFGVLSRIILYSITFLMLCVAENSFEQRLQYAKHFCRLTSSRRARKYYLPHFRLNKLANIKCWLSLRSYLKKQGPQRSVESIISSAFYMLLAMLSLVCVNLLQNGNISFINKLINWDLTLCSLALGIFMMRFLVLGTKITKKYRNLSVIITEQINLFLAMQTRPHKKEELTLAHNVLRLAESLLKEVEGPFRICGWSMNPFLYNILKVVILSVFSTILSETLGFKMKLYKIKINPANW